MFTEDNTIQYLKEFGHLTFQEKEFCLVDSLILCQLSYFKFQGMVGEMGSESEPAAVKSFREHPDMEKLFGETVYQEQYRTFYVALYNSRRFRELQMNDYVDLVDETMEMQFSAITFFLEDLVYIAIRGTDETIVGWKEDFNMAFLSPIPSQVAALKYLKRIGEQYKGNIRIGGHSKGGNAAIYAAMEADAELRKRIVQVDCFDGPGFRDDIYETENYLDISKRICKLVPEQSFIGMLLVNKGKYKVVKSMSSGALQHDPFTWVVKDGNFEYVKEIYRSSIYKNKALNGWIQALSKEQLSVFVDALFQIINGAEASTLVELTEEGYKGALAMLTTFSHLDKDTKKFMSQVIRLLFGNVLKKNKKE